MLLKNKLSYYLFFFIFVLFLSGCNSDSLSENLQDTIDEVRDKDTEFNTDTKTGIFLDSIVSGLNYTCSGGISGVTNASGEFTCDKNNTISFSLGSNNLGDSELLNYITPFTLFKENTVAAINLAQLLQSLDIDKDLKNGIEIDNELLSNLGTIDFNSSSFDTDMEVLLGNDNSLINEKIALANMEIDFVALNINNDGTFPRVISGNTAPILTIENVLSVTENQSIAFTVTAIDLEADKLIYSITGTDANSFNIDSSSGVVSFKVFPDFEQKKSYKVTINVSDGNLNDSDNLIINIINVGEDSPTLLNSIAAIPENSLESATVGNIIIDSVGDTDIESIVLLGIGNENFKVDSNGLITVSSVANLDFETTPFYSLSAIATNTSGDSASVNVDITITNIGEQKIISAVYNDKNTSVVTDDILYLYMNESIDPLSINADRSLNYDVNGSGILSSDVDSVYDDTLFHRNKITMTAGSTKFIENIDKILIKIGQITDLHGSTAIGTESVTIEKFNVLSFLRTGQIISFPNANSLDRDDGFYQKSLIRSYSLDADSNETIIDNASGLIWQKEDDNVKRNWSDSKTYCESLNLNSLDGFRVPTIQELVSITDKGRYNPAIDPIFINTKNSSNYWSSTVDVSKLGNAWFVFFYAGHGLSGSKDSLNYIRCVR